MELTLEGTLTSVTMNAERAGKEFGEEVGSALKLEFHADVDELVGLFHTKASHKMLLANQFREDGEIVQQDLDVLPLKTKLEDVHAMISSAVGTDASAEKFSGCRFQEVELLIGPGPTIKGTAMLYVYPTDQQWAPLRHLLKKSVKVQLAGGKASLAAKAAQGDLRLRRGKKEKPGSDAAPVH